MRTGGGVELVEHDAGLNSSRTRGGINLKNAAKVLGQVHLNPGAAGLTGQSGARSARRDRAAVPGADLDDRHHVVRIERLNHAERHDPVHARIRRVNGAMNVVKVDRAAHRLAQIALEGAGLDMRNIVGRGARWYVDIRCGHAREHTAAARREKVRWRANRQVGGCASILALARRREMSATALCARGAPHHSTRLGISLCSVTQHSSGHRPAPERGESF